MPRETAPTVAYRRSARSRELVRLAERQYGVVSREQLRTLGFKESAIDRRLRAQLLHELQKGVYALGHEVIPREGRWLAAVVGRDQAAPQSAAVRRGNGARRNPGDLP